MASKVPASSRPARPRIHWLSRSITALIVALALGSLLWQPGHPVTIFLDIAFRAYLMFLGTVMAHEGVHGHLGRSKSANAWWGRLALLPSLVPFTSFRKTHHLHHAHTNLPDKDPDYFVKPKSPLEIPLRAVAMPHHWYVWLERRKLMKPSDRVELALNYAGILAVYTGLLLWIGPWRLLVGIGPSLFLVCLLLWYPFAVRTHEGYSTGDPSTRSHDYYGRVMYWFSLGLSMHRAHHLRPYLSWIELRPLVREAPHSLGARRFLIRDIRTSEPQS